MYHGAMTMSAYAPPADVVHSSDGILWDQDGLTDAGEMVYTEGDCWALAWAVFSLLESEGLDDLAIYTLGEQASWWHVVVRVGEDTYLDANGLSSGAEQEAKWGRKLCLVPSSAVASLGAFQDDYLDMELNFNITHSITDQVAGLLIEQHLGM